VNASLPPIDLSSDVDPWERQEHQETPYRFGQFSVYLDLGRTRTLRKVAETLTRSHGYVRQVSASYRWVERAEAWDKHRKHLDELLWIEERRKAAANDNRVLSAIVGQLATRVQTLNAADLSVGDFTRLLDVTMRQRRLLFGPEQPTTVEVTGPGGGQLTVQIAELVDMDADQRRAAILALAESVQRRAHAAARGDDDE